MKWTSNLTGPIRYFLREQAELLYQRSECRKRVQDFDGALADLRTCLAIIKSFYGGSWKENSSHLSSALVPIVTNSSEALSDIATCIQIVLALQKVSSGASRPHYSKEETAAIEEELGISSVSILLVKIVNNHNIGARDRWAYEEFGVFQITTPLGENRVLVSDGQGGHFESLTDEKYYVVSPENADEVLSKVKEMCEARGVQFKQM